MRNLRSVFRAGEPTLADRDPEARRALARDMVGGLPHPDSDDYDPDAPPASHRAYALSYMLNDSTLSTPFLDTMGDELDHYERDVMGEYNMTWRQMTMGGIGGTMPFAEGEREAAFDPMTSYMSALGHNDEAALQFFTAGGENDHDAGAQGRQDYWIGHRHWSHDDFDGLMSALDAATTGEDNLTVPDTAQDAGNLMSHAVNHLANRSELDWNADGEAFEPGDVSNGGTKSMAHMLGTYMPAVDQALEEPLPNGAASVGIQALTSPRFGDGLANMPMFSAVDLKEMANVAVSSEDGFNAMRDGVSTYQNIQLSNSIEQHGMVDDGTSMADARIEGFFVNAVGDTEIAEGAEEDERIQAWINMGKSAAGAVPIPGGSVVQALANAGLEGGAMSLSDQLATNEGAAVDSSNDYARGALQARQEAFQQALVDAGVIEPSDVATQLTDPEGSSYTTEQVEAWFPNGQFPTPE